MSDQDSLASGESTSASSSTSSDEIKYASSIEDGERYLTHLLTLSQTERAAELAETKIKDRITLITVAIEGDDPTRALLPELMISLDHEKSSRVLKCAITAKQPAILEVIWSHLDIRPGAWDAILRRTLSEPTMLSELLARLPYDQRRLQWLLEHAFEANRTNLATIKVLHEAGADVTGAEFMAEAIKGHISLVTYLLQHGAEVGDLRTKNLVRAARSSGPAIVPILHLLRVHQADIQEPLAALLQHRLIRKDGKRLIELLQMGAPINQLTVRQMEIVVQPLWQMGRLLSHHIKMFPYQHVVAYAALRRRVRESLAQHLSPGMTEYVIGSL